MPSAFRDRVRDQKIALQTEIDRLVKQIADLRATLDQRRLELTGISMLIDALAQMTQPILNEIDRATVRK